MEEAYSNFSNKPWQQSGKAYMMDLIQDIISYGRKVKAECFNNEWLEFDTNEDYENACQWVKDGSIGNFIKL